MSASWEAMLKYMRQHPDPQRPQDIQHALAMRRMVEAGLLQRVAPGVYALAGSSVVPEASSLLEERNAS